MLPTNSSKATTKGCVPTSSECVIWQGPDLDCIKLCRGDTISIAIYKIAVELCTLMDMFDLTDYDLSCLNLTVSQTPENVGELIKILISRICQLENIEIIPGDNNNGCPDCIVNIAQCFQSSDTTGTSITTMNLLDYITAIGNRICGIIDTLGSHSDRLDALGQDAAGLRLGITGLETDKVSESALQYQLSTKTDAAGRTLFLPKAVREIENSLIESQDAIGPSDKMFANIVKAGNITTENLLIGDGKMSSLVGWTDQVSNASESIGNAWLAIRDIREAVEYLNINTIANDCSQLNLNFRASIAVGGSTFVSIYTDGSLGFNSEWSECNNTTTILIKDSDGNSTTVTAKLIDLISDHTGLQIDITATPVDPTLDITVIAKTCFYNKSSKVTCEKDYTYLISPGNSCPSATITIYPHSVSYQFTTVTGYNYIVNVYLRNSGALVASQVINSPGISVNNLISGLNDGTEYDLQITTVNSAGGEVKCGITQFMTIPVICVGPTTAIITETIT